MADHNWARDKAGIEHGLVELDGILSINVDGTINAANTHMPGVVFTKPGPLGEYQGRMQYGGVDDAYRGPATPTYALRSIQAQLMGNIAGAAITVHSVRVKELAAALNFGVTPATFTLVTMSGAAPPVAVESTSVSIAIRIVLKNKLVL